MWFGVNQILVGSQNSSDKFRHQFRNFLLLFVFEIITWGFISPDLRGKWLKLWNYREDNNYTSNYIKEKHHDIYIYIM